MSYVCYNTHMLQMTVGMNLKNIRVASGLSQIELSKISGVERAQLSKIEKGDQNVTIDTIEKLSSALNISPSTLFEIYETVSIHPFVKWAGGKGQLISKLRELMPKHYDNYYEPFVGGGALLFSILPKKAFINDYNSELISVYECMQSDVMYYEMLVQLQLHEKQHSEEYYYQVRNMDRNGDFSSLSKPARAARMIYLNKSCFNGLYRVNSKGFFNVPSGKKKSVKTYDEENMKRIRSYFQNNEISISNGDFEEAVSTVQPKDFIYFDPPYDTWEDKESFTSYAKDSFNKESQARLAKVFAELSKFGAYVMASNHNTAYIRELYKKFNIHVVDAKRIINSNPNGRGCVEEVIITNY